MKKRLSLIMVFLLFILSGSVMVLGADNTIGPSIQIVKNDITPEPVEPGNDITLKVMITNSGDDLAKNVNVIPEIEAPFYFKNSDFNKKDFAICGGCSYDATYYLGVKSNTTSGTYPINFHITYGSSSVTKDTILVKVIGVPDLVIEYNKGEVHYPEDNFDMTLSLKNIGTGNAKNIKITALSDKFLLAGSQTKIVDFLSVDNSNEVKLNFQVDSTIASGLYKIPLEVTYLNELGEPFTKTYDVSVNIKDAGSIELQNLKIDSYQSKIFDDILINGIIENNGDGKAENIYAYIETDLDGYKKSFVGSLDADEDSPIQFKLKSSKTGKFPIKLIIHYEDDKGVHQVEEDLEVEVIKPINNTNIVIVVIVVLVLALIIGRYALKNKNKKKEK